MESGEKHSEGRGDSARMRVSGSVERLLRHIGEDSLPSRRRREETIVRVDERKEARCDYSHAPPRGLPHRDSRQ